MEAEKGNNLSTMTIQEMVTVLTEMVNISSFALIFVCIFVANAFSVVFPGTPCRIFLTVLLLQCPVSYVQLSKQGDWLLP